MASLADAYLALARWSDLERVTGRLQALVPSQTGWLLHARALGRQGKPVEMDAWARTGGATRDACLLRMDAAGFGGDMPSLDRIAEECMRLGLEPGRVLNEHAWWGLFQPGNEEVELEWAREAARLRGYKDEGTNHTLGLLLAENDDPDGALELLEGALKDGALEPSWELVRGKMAADLGYPAAARTIWALVPLELDHAPNQVGALAAAWSAGR